MRLLTVCCVAILAAASLASNAEAQRTRAAVDLELVLAVDVSSSVDANEALLQRQGHITAIRDRRFHAVIASGDLGRIAMAYVEWADDARQRVLIDWQLIESPADANRFADALGAAPRVTGSYTSIGAVIDFAHQMTETNTFEGARRVIDISGDGPNNDGTSVTEARNRAVAAGITINGLPIMYDGPAGGGFHNFRDLDLYYANCVIGGDGAFLVVAQHFGDIATAVLRKMLREIAAPSDLSNGYARHRDGAALIPTSSAALPPACDVRKH